MEDNRATFSLSVSGDETKTPYNGEFEVKTLLTRRDAFLADERRREVIGSNPEGVAPSIQAEAYMIGQLLVRITKAPTWWVASQGGYDLPDGNIIVAIFELALQKESDRKKGLVEKADKAKESLKKTKE